MVSGQSRDDELLFNGIRSIEPCGDRKNYRKTYATNNVMCFDVEV